MKAIFLMQGVPASGKSSFIPEEVRPFVIEPDAIRTMFAGVENRPDGGYTIPQDMDSRVWKLVYEAVESRMELGSTIIVDATNTNQRSIGGFKSLAERYGYKTYIVRVDTPLEECLRRNAERGFKSVPENVIRRKHRELQEFKTPAWINGVYSAEGRRDFWEIVYDVAWKYFPKIAPAKKVAVIGDLHGMKLEFEELLERLSDCDTFVFVGDYFDRFDNEEEMISLLRILLALQKNRNMIFLRGNHEPVEKDLFYYEASKRLEKLERELQECRVRFDKARNVRPRKLSDIEKELKEARAKLEENEFREFAKKMRTEKRAAERLNVLPIKIKALEAEISELEGSLRNLKISRQHRETLEALRRNGELKTYIKFVQNLHSAALVDLGQKYLFVNHAGVSKVPLGKDFLFLREEELFRGAGGYEDVDELLKNFHEEGFVQVFGHRSPSEEKVYPGCVNVNGDAEQGGSLRAAVFEAFRFDPFERMEEVRTERVPRYHSKGFVKDRIVDMAEENPYVKVKRLSDDIFSIQFSEQAFFKGVWDSMTIHARGLFVRRENGKEKIVARGFHKFFNIGEMPYTKLDYIKEKWEFPLVVEEKANGYLGIFSAYEKNGKIIPFIASKSTNEGRFAEMFREILEQSVLDWNGLLAKIRKHDVTLLFEVIHVDDPHIEKYPERNQLVLIGVVRNELEFSDLFEELPEEFTPFFSPTHVRKKGNAGTIIETPEDLEEFIEKHNSVPLDSPNYVEGFVIKSPTGKIGRDPQMTKLKTDWYSFWKLMRSAMQISEKRRFVEEVFDSIVPKAKERFGEEGEALAREFIEFFWKNNRRFQTVIEAREAFLSSRKR